MFLSSYDCLAGRKEAYLSSWATLLPRYSCGGLDGLAVTRIERLRSGVLVTLLCDAATAWPAAVPDTLAYLAWWNYLFLCPPTCSILDGDRSFLPLLTIAAFAAFIKRSLESCRLWPAKVVRLGLIWISFFRLWLVVVFATIYLGLTTEALSTFGDSTLLYESN